MLKVLNTLLYKLRDVGQLSQNLGISRSLQELVQVLIDGLNRVLVAIVNLEYLKFLIESSLLFLVLFQKVGFKLLSFLFELFDDF